MVHKADILDRMNAAAPLVSTLDFHYGTAQSGCISMRGKGLCPANKEHARRLGAPKQTN